jgi:acetyltransferase-like isoleucine patch superfamily enzyme
LLSQAVELCSGNASFGEGAFLAPCAVLVALKGKTIVVGAGASVGAQCFLKGPIELGADVSLNPRCHLDGGSKGIMVGAGTRVAAGLNAFAFNHGMAPNKEVRSQKTSSQGIVLGKDVWVGANVGELYVVWLVAPCSSNTHSVDII